MGNTPGTELPASGGGSNVELENLDAALDTQVTLPDDQGGSSAEDTTQPEVGADGKPKTGADDSQQDQQGKQDGRVIPQWMRELKEKNPKAYDEAKNSLFDLRDRRSIHPTVQAAREEHDLVQSLGGQDGVTQLREDANFFHDAATQFLKGDAAFTEDLFTEDPIAAALHVAPMLQQYAKHDPEGYKSTLARMWHNEFQQTGFTPALADLIQAIEAGDKKTASEIAKSIQSWQQSITSKATQAEDPRVKTMLAERAREHDTRQQTEHKEFLKSYTTDSINKVVESASRVFDSFFKGHKLDAEDRKDLLREAIGIANRAILADADFVKQRDGHLDKRDSHSAQRLTISRYERELPEAVKKVARRYGLISGKTAAGTQQQQQQQRQTQQQTPAGYIKINDRPNPEDVDRSRTSNDMILSGKAILKNGKKVDWSHLKKAASAA